MFLSRAVVDFASSFHRSHLLSLRWRACWCRYLSRLRRDLDVSLTLDTRLLPRQLLLFVGSEHHCVLLFLFELFALLLDLFQGPLLLSLHPRLQFIDLPLLSALDLYGRSSNSKPPTTFLGELQIVEETVVLNLDNGFDLSPSERLDVAFAED